MESSVVFTVAPYHILAYGTLLGTSVFHSFISAPVTFKTVPRHTFSTIASKLFPIYSGLQTALPAILALTYPGSIFSGTASGISGLLHNSNRWGSLVPIAAMFGTALINLTVLYPIVDDVIKARRGQVKRDGKEWYAEGPHSEEMLALNRKFGITHGISSLLNLGTIIGAIVYGFTLGGRLQSIADRI